MAITYSFPFSSQGDVFLLANLEDAVQSTELIIECIEEDVEAKSKLFQSEHIFKKFLFS